jgi:anti-anti-sigma factor
VTASFNIETFEREGSLFLVVQGELDLATADRLDDKLERAVAADAAAIVVDLDRVDFIDSSGLQVLIKHACDQERERIRLTEGSPQAQRLFEITGARDRLPFLSRQ